MKNFLFLLLAISTLSYGVSQARSIQPGDVVASSTGTPSITQTATPSLPQTALPSSAPVIEPTHTPLPPVSPLDITKPTLEAFLRVPPGVVPTPYIILSGYQSITGDNGAVSISGVVQDKSFFCPSSPCAIEFPITSLVSFHAQNAKGDKSDEIQANILVTKMADGYSLTVISLSKFVIFSDSCGTIWQNIEERPAFWAKFPQDPGDLNTDKSLHYLAGKLLTTGVVDARDCPGGGFDGDAPNPCGLERVKEQMTAWQNQFDFNIWLVSKDEHIPPIILKTLIEIESQFWPTSQRRYLDELGLGQINQLGIDVLLRNNPGLYLQICSTALYRCDKPYESLSGIDRALIRGALVQSLDAGCPSCLYGVNLNKAAQSISLISKVLYSNCVQAKEILKLHGVTANYEDSWKFTMVSYHSGFGCLQYAVDKSAEAGTSITWDTVSKNLNCAGAASYVDRFWVSLLSFNQFLKKPEQLQILNLQLPTPIPTLVRPTSTARILVQIFFDQNGDGIQQPNEALDNVQVDLNLENGISRTEISKNGIAIFDLSGISIGVRGKINLPGLYRSASIQVPTSGDMPIIFIFTRPALPTQLP